MREKLKNIGNDSRHTFTATFERYGLKRAYKGPAITTLLFINIELDHAEVADHLWFTMTKGFEECNLTPGDIVQFDGRVKKYIKGYRGHRIDVYVPIEEDFKIERPTKIRIVKRNE